MNKYFFGSIARYSGILLFSLTCNFSILFAEVPYEANPENVFLEDNEEVGENDSLDSILCCRRGPAGPQGIQGPTGATGPQGAQGDTGPAGAGVGYAEFINTDVEDNTAVSSGTAFTIATEVYNSVPTDIVSSAGAGGTVFTLSAGTYVIDYELSLTSTGPVGIYLGTTVGTLALDSDTVSGSIAVASWVHGRAIEVLASPLVMAISPVGSIAVLSPAGLAGTNIIRLTILKIA